MSKHERKYLAMMIIFGIFLATDKQFGFSWYWPVIDSIALMYAGYQFAYGKDDANEVK